MSDTSEKICDMDIGIPFRNARPSWMLVCSLLEMVVDGRRWCRWRRRCDTCVGRLIRFSVGKSSVPFKISVPRITGTRMFLWYVRRFFVLSLLIRTLCSLVKGRRIRKRGPLWRFSAWWTEDMFIYLHRRLHKGNEAIEQFLRRAMALVRFVC